MQQCMLNSVENRRCSSVDSVGMLDTASTKALAGSLYTRLAPPPLYKTSTKPKHIIITLI